MVLRNPIAAHNIIGDPAVAHFNQQLPALQPGTGRLEADRGLYRQFLLSELFNFNGLKTKIKGFEELTPDMQKDILDVAAKLIRQLTTLDVQRVKNAATYFHGKLETVTKDLHHQLPALIGKSNEKAAKADELLKWIMARVGLMAHFSTTNFSVIAYLDAKQNSASTSAQAGQYVKALNAKPNEKLFDEMMIWRDTVATKEKVMPNMILSEKTVAAIAEKLPPTLKAISAIKGVGPQKAAQYGAVLIATIRAYQQQAVGSDTEQGSLF
jgi:superfamily II DNA helicase RecQ